MGVVLGLVCGAGLVLVYLSIVAPRSETARREPRLSRMAVLLVHAGVPARPWHLAVACLAVSGVVLVAVQAISRTVPVSAAFAMLAGYLPIAFVAGRARRRQRERADVWPEAMDHLASAVRAGMSLPEALGQLAVRGPEPLRAAFSTFAVDYQVTGRFGECLDRLKDRLADPVGDRVVEGLRLARDVGSGDVGRLLRGLSGYLREEARTRSELESRQAWVVNGARLAVAAPWLVLFMLSFQREVIGRYASPGGVVVLAGGAGCCVVAYRLMLRVGRLPQDQRVLS